jgi:hypothetical protein
MASATVNRNATRIVQQASDCTPGAPEAGLIRVDVEKLWTRRAKPVEKLTTQKYLRADRARIAVIADVDAGFVRRFA